MSQPTLWSKMRGWVKPGGRSSLSGSHALPPTETNRTASAQGSGVGETSPSSSESAPAGPLSLWRRNHSTFEKLQEGQSKVIELIDSLQVHQHQQDARAREISSSLSQVSSTLISIEGADRQQAEKLAEIADVLRQGQDRAARWEEKVAELPQLAQAQRDALSTVATQMEAAGAREGHMASSLDSFREAVTALGDATTSSSVAVKSLQMSELESHERMVALLKEQNKRFTMLFSVTLVLVVIAIVAGLAALFKN